MAPDPSHLGIGDVARAAGLSVEAVRYYESEGLLAPTRDASGRRRYRPVDVDALAVVTALRGAGFGIREIAGVMGIKRESDGPAARIAVGLRAVEGLSARLDERQAALDRARTLLEGWRAELLDARDTLAADP